MEVLWKNDLPFNFLLAAEISHGSDVFHNDFAGFGLARAGFTAYHHARIATQLFHLPVDGISDRENVRRILKQLPT